LYVSPTFIHPLPFDDWYKGIAIACQDLFARITQDTGLRSFFDPKSCVFAMSQLTQAR
jgi:hypothetical protein